MCSLSIDPKCAFSTSNRASSSVPVLLPSLQSANLDHVRYGYSSVEMSSVVEHHFKAVNFVSSYMPAKFLGSCSVR